MNGWKFVLIFISLITFVGGQLLFKHAMERSRTHAFGRKVAKWLVAGPFQGLSVIIISVLAALVLKEKLTLRLALGALLITAGVILVSMS